MIKIPNADWLTILEEVVYGDLAGQNTWIEIGSRCDPNGQYFYCLIGNYTVDKEDRQAARDRKTISSEWLFAGYHERWMERAIQTALSKLFGKCAEIKNQKISIAFGPSDGVSPQPPPF